MGRIIVNNRSDLPDLTALELVAGVVKRGRISYDNKQYCYLSIFKVGEKEYGISTDLRKGSDSFIVWEYPTKK